MRILRHHQITEMAAQSCNEDMRVKTFFNNLVEGEKHIWNPVFMRQIYDVKILVVIKNIEYLGGFGEGNVFLGKCRKSVEDGKRVAQCTVGFLGNQVKGI